MTSTATARPTRWWHTASNPSCAALCDRQHDLDEFASSGGFLCTRSIASTQLFEVEAQVYTSAGEHGRYDVDPPAVWCNVRHLGNEPMTPDEAREFGLNISMALTKAAAVCEGKA